MPMRHHCGRATAQKLLSTRSYLDQTFSSPSKLATTRTDSAALGCALPDPALPSCARESPAQSPAESPGESPAESGSSRTDRVRHSSSASGSKTNTGLPDCPAGLPNCRSSELPNCTEHSGCRPVRPSSARACSPAAKVAATEANPRAATAAVAAAVAWRLSASSSDGGGCACGIALASSASSAAAAAAAAARPAATAMPFATAAASAASAAVAAASSTRKKTSSTAASSGRSRIGPRECGRGLAPVREGVSLSQSGGYAPSSRTAVGWIVARPNSNTRAEFLSEFLSVFSAMTSGTAAGVSTFPASSVLGERLLKLAGSACSCLAGMAALSCRARESRSRRTV
mmetsp:Transcript_22128/g.56073  ORF Transcript_22128/g.56073 Transcript_22128/m.56073 type:complete len:344 (+) Transcript_22128:152-1183(+)